MGRLLPVEDDDRIGALLSDQLRRPGFAVAWARTLAEAWRLSEEPPDLALVDLGLPMGTARIGARGCGVSTRTRFWWC